jgi:apolipoprotein N-acyltransferase
MIKIIFSCFGGLLMGMTPAPFEAWYLAWVALIPLYLLVIHKKSPPKEIILIALAWGCAYHGLGLSWITGIHPMTWMGVPWLASLAIAIFCWVFITLWGAALVIVWSLLLNYFSRQIGIKKERNYRGLDILLRVLLATTIWCILETIWSWGALWWTSLSYTQSPHNLAILQLSQFSGPNGIVALIVAVNALFAEAILLVNFSEIKYSVKNIVLLSLPLFFYVSWHAIGFNLYNRPLANNPNNVIEVGIIQGNIPNAIKLYPEGWAKAIEGYTTGYKELAARGVDVVLTPETALPFYWEDLVNRNSSFYQAILESKVSTWLGAFGRIDRGYTNSLLTINYSGKILSRYDKVKLVPLGEYIPFEPILGKLIDRLSPLDTHLIAGNKEQIFSTPWGKAIVGICYESAFAEHFRRQTERGGEFIITASNNAHYSKTMPAQHHAQDVMRAIETDRWAARATNTGYSAIVNPRGKTLWISEINTYQIKDDKIYRRNTQTLYVHWGDWLTKLLFGLSCIFYYFYNYFISDEKI